MTAVGGARQPIAIASLLALFVGCALAGGTGNAIDLAVAAQAAALRTHLVVLNAAEILTWLGSAPVTLAAAALAAVMLALRRRHASAIVLLVTVVLTRLAVDGLKLFVGRPRPAFDPHLAIIHSLSFPSGHAANSLATYLMLACFLAPGRKGAVLAAAAVSLVVGLTRVLLGVHWLSDVIGGWSFGAFAVMLALAVDRRLGAQKQ